MIYVWLLFTSWNFSEIYGTKPKKSQSHKSTCKSRPHLETKSNVFNKLTEPRRQSWGTPSCTTRFETVQTWILAGLQRRCHFCQIWKWDEVEDIYCTDDYVVYSEDCMNVWLYSCRELNNFPMKLILKTMETGIIHFIIQTFSFCLTSIKAVLIIASFLMQGHHTKRSNARNT